MKKRHNMKSKTALRCGMMSFTNNLSRARHSVHPPQSCYGGRVRAVVSGGARLLTSRLARTLAPPTPGRGLPALPILPSLFVKGKIPLCGLAMAVVLQLGLLAGSAQTYIYTYTGNDFTSVFNAANELLYGFVPYTTSDKITGSITFSAPLGANYSGNPSATLLSYNFTDGVGPQNVVGSTLGGGLGFPYVMNSTFGTDSSGAIVSWNFSVIGFSPSGTIAKGIQTENDSGNVGDSGNLDEVGVIAGQGSVSSNPGGWVETIVPKPVPTPTVISTHAAFGFTNGLFGFNMTGPSGSNVVIQASTDLQTWIPLQTNLLGSGPLYFSDAQSTTNVQRIYRVQLSP